MTALAQNFQGEIPEMSLNINQEGKMMGENSTGIQRGAIVEEAVIPTGILLGSPEIRILTIGMLTSSNTTSMQMMKKELIRSYLLVLVGNQGAALILIMLGQETIHDMLTKILMRKMMVLDIGARIKTENLNFSSTRNIKMTHRQKELDLVEVMDVLKIWKGREIGIQWTEIFRMRKKIITGVQEILEVNGISPTKSLGGIEVTQFPEEMIVNIARVKVLRVILRKWMMKTLREIIGRNMMIPKLRGARTKSLKNQQSSQRIKIYLGVKIKNQLQNDQSYLTWTKALLLGKMVMVCLWFQV